MCFLLWTILKKPARTTQSYFTCDKHIPLSEASELLVKRPVLCSPRCLHQHANRRRCVPTVWKGPAAVHAKSLFWRTRWAKNMAASIRFPLRHLSVMTGRKQEWNKPLYILIICSAPSPNWNDGKITPPDDRRWIKSFRPVSLHFSPAIPPSRVSSSSSSSSDRPYVLQCCFVSVG